MRALLRFIGATVCVVFGVILTDGSTLAVSPNYSSNVAAPAITLLPEVDSIPKPDGLNAANGLPGKIKSNGAAKPNDREERAETGIGGPAIGDAEIIPLPTVELLPAPSSFEANSSSRNGESEADPKQEGRPFGGIGMKGPGMGMGGPGMAGPGMGGPGYGVTWYPTTETTGARPGSTLALVRQRIGAGAPLWSNGKDMAMFSVGVQNSLFLTDAILPQSEQPFPSNLWNISFSTNYMHQFENGWMGMVGINFGSASDQPFHSIEEMNMGVMSFLRVPARNQRDAWMFMLMYSPVGNVNFPIPGVSYQWNPSETFQASIGIPFSIVWCPLEKLTINITYMPIINGIARITYELSETLCLYGGFESCQEVYLLADREVLSDRFMGFEQRLHSGMQWNFWKHAVLDLSAGYAFDRYYGTGQNQIGANSLQDRIDVGSGAFLAASAQFRF